MGQGSSALRSELSLGHFGTSADMSGQFGRNKLVPKCPGSEVSVILSRTAWASGESKKLLICCWHHWHKITCGTSLAGIIE